MSAQFAIEPVNRMAHIAGASYRLGGNGFCVEGNKSLVAKQEDTSKPHRLVRMTVRLACDRIFRNQQQIIPFEICLRIGNVTHSKVSRVLCIKTATFRPGQTYYLPLA
jgi:hypothetical protein